MIALSIWKGDIEVAEPKPMMRVVALEVAARTGVSLEEMVGPSRLRPVVLARHEAMYEIRRQTFKSLGAIGALFNRHHTSVLEGCRRHANRQQGAM